MTTPISYATPLDSQPLPFKDRRTSLMVAGACLLVFGSLSGCFGVLAPVGMFVASTLRPPAGATRPAPQFELDWRSMAAAVMTYVAAAAVLIWAGTGAVRVRRWARPVALILGWMWLVTGVMALAYWIVAAPSMRDIMVTATATSTRPGVAPTPPAVFNAIAWGTGIFMALFMVALPAVLVWAFQRSGVRETLEFFDPRIRWTDACPTPVLAISAWLALSAVATLMYAVYGVLPLFGLMIVGPVAIAGFVVVVAVFALLAWQTYRLRPAAWWGALIAITFWAANTIWTFSRTGWDEFYRRAGYSPSQVDMMAQYSGGYQGGMLWMVAVWAVVWIAYLLYARKYFWPRAEAANAS